MNIAYSSDENYAQHLCVSLVSLLKNNKNVKSLNLFIISNEITDHSKQKIENVAKQFDRKISWIDFTPFKKRLTLNMEWPISVSSYARLFLTDLLPVWCEKVIYLDCDTLICQSLLCLWNVELNSTSVAGVDDLISHRFKRKIGLNSTDHYINAGVLLINLKKWREQEIDKIFIRFINEHNGQITHHDQGVINAILHRDCSLLPPCYNAMTPFFTTKYNDLRAFYQLERYYSKEEIQHAVEDPVIIHFTPEFVGRAWEYECKHPKAELYRKYLALTPWKDQLVHAKRKPLKLQILYWIQKNIEAKMLGFLFRLSKDADGNEVKK